MAKIDVEIFTNEIEKTYTILKQNLIMIDTIKQLIAQGNLSEDTIASLNTALSTTNSKLDNLNTFTKQEFLRTNQKISAVETTQENMNNIMPTDINTDTNGYLILEHDGVEITGQKKLLKYPFTYDNNTNTFEIGNNLEVNGTTKFNKGITIMNQLEPIITTYDNEGNPVHILLEQPDTITIYTDNGITYIPISGEDGIVVKDINLKTIFGNQSIYTEDGTGNIDLYVYTLKLSASFSGGMGYIYIDYQTSDNNNNVEVNSVTKFTTLTKATEGSIISCICSKETGDGVTVIGNNIRYENGVWYVYRNDTKYSYSYQGQVSNATITNCSQLKKRSV